MTTQTRRKPTTAARKAAAAPEADTAPAASLQQPQPQPDGHSREDLIRRLAYERYQRNGCVDGHALDDWLAAEGSVCALAATGAAVIEPTPARP